MFEWLKKKKKPLADTVVLPPTPSGDGLATSIVLGYMLNDGVTGGIIGGNLAGGIIGDAMNTSESHRSCDSGTSHDSGGPCDSGSSYDSGGCGGDF